MSRITDIAQAWHDDGDDDAHVIYQTANEIVEDMAERYGLEMTQAQQMQIEMALHEPVKNSIDWDKIAEDDENAREWDEARRSGLKG